MKTLTYTSVLLTCIHKSSKAFRKSLLLKKSMTTTLLFVSFLALFGNTVLSQTIYNARVTGITVGTPRYSGQSISITAGIKNTGTGTGTNPSSFQVKLIVKEYGLIFDTEVSNAWQTIYDVYTTADKNITFNWTPAKASKYKVIVEVYNWYKDTRYHYLESSYFDVLAPFTVTGVNVSVTPSTLNEGVLMTKSATITGTGSGTVNYRWEDKNPGSTTWNPIMNQTVTMTNGTATISAFQIPAYAPGGTHYHRIVVTSPSSKTSNEVGVTVNVPPPDLVVTSVVLGSSSVQVGNSLNVTFTAKNQGTGVSWAVLAGVYVSTSLYGVQTFLGNIDVPSLAAGSSVTLTKSVTIPSNLSAGTYYIDVYVDYTNEDKRESNELNNVNGKSITIIRFTATAVTVSVTPSNLNEGVLMTKSATITGTGSGTVNYRWEDKNPGSTTWNPIMNQTVSMTNGTATISAFQIPAYAPGGTHYHRIVVTAPSSVTSNEVGVTVNVPPPDLIVSSVVLSSSSVQVGNNLNVTFTAKNQGTGVSWGVLAGVYVSTSQYGVQTFLGNIDVPSLASGATVTLTKSVTIPSNLSAGNYYIDVYVDYTNEDKRESNELNNVNSKSISIIRFTVTGVSVSVTPSSLNEGALMTKSASITGTGSGTINYRWEDKDPGTTTWNPIMDQTVTMTNGSATISPFQIPAYAPGGTHYHRIVVTNPNSIISNEIPNTVAVKVAQIQETHPGCVNGSIIDLGISSDIKIDFTEDLNPLTVTNQSVRLYRADNTPISYTLTYEKRSLLLLRDSRIIINSSALQYGTLYILEIGQPLEDMMGRSIDGDGDGLAGGIYKIGIQVQYDPNFSSVLKAKIESETNSYIPNLTITNVRNDLWALTNYLEGQIVSDKDNRKPNVILQGVNNMSIVHSVIDGDLNYKVDGKIYHVANLRFTTNAGSSQNWKIVLDSDGIVVKDISIMYKVLLTYYNRSNKFDRAFLEANKDALNWLNVGQILNDAFVLIRDGAVSVVFSLPGGQTKAFVVGVVEKIASDLPSLFLSVFLHSYNAYLRGEYDLALAKAYSQTYPLLDYNDVSYYWYSQEILYRQNTLFFDLTDAVWKDRGNLNNQMIEVMAAIKTGLVNKVSKLPVSDLTSLMKVTSAMSDAALLIKGLVDSFDYMKSFELSIQNTKTTIGEVLLNPSNVAECLLAAELWYGITSVKDFEDIEIKSGISVYPNPVSDILNIEYKNDNYESVKVLNPLGKVLLNVKSSSPVQKLNFSKFEQGFYILEFNKESGEPVRIKVLKK